MGLLAVEAAWSRKREAASGSCCTAVVYPACFYSLVVAGIGSELGWRADSRRRPLTLWCPSVSGPSWRGYDCSRPKA